MIARRTLFALPLALAAKAPPPSLADDVATFVRFGEHRAGTAVERKTAAWLARRLARLGYGVSQQKVPIRTLLDPRGVLDAGSGQTPVFPQWLPPRGALGRTIQGVLLPLSAPPAPGAIRLLTCPARLTANWIDPLDALVREASEKGAAALVLALNDPSNALFVCNQHHPEPFPIPVALIARAALPGLVEATGRTAKLRLDGRMADTHALNVIGRKPGTGRTLVISTPLTGWFHCGGERGPGIALWLRMAAKLAREARPVVMLGTGSHEIGHLGMDYALRNGMPAPEAVDLWLHFGASLAATRLDERYRYKSGQYLVGTETSAAQAKASLGAVMPFYVPGTSQTLGEAGQVIGAGHRRFVGMSGQFPTFHTPLDKGEAIDFAQLERVAHQAAELIDRFREG